MSITPEVLQKISEYEAQGYGADEIAAGLASSKNFPEIAAKVKTYQGQGYTGDEIMAGIKSSPVAKTLKALGEIEAQREPLGVSAFEQMSKPENPLLDILKNVKRDESEADYLRRTAPPARPPEDSWPSALGKMAKNIPGEFVKSLGGGLDFYSDWARLQMPEGLAKKDDLGPRIYQAGEGIQTPINAEPGSLKGYVTSAGSSVLQNLPWLVAGAFTRSPKLALTGMSAMSTGGKYPELTAAGVPPEKALPGATVHGLAEAIGEAQPTKKLLEVGVPFLKRALSAYGWDLAGEQVTELIQAANDKKLIQPDMTWGDLARRMIDTGIVTTIAGPVQAGAIHPLVRGAQGAAARSGVLGKDAQAETQLLDLLNAAAKQAREERKAAAKKVYVGTTAEQTAGARGEGVPGGTPGAGVTPINIGELNNRTTTEEPQGEPGAPGSGDLGTGKGKTPPQGIAPFEVKRSPTLDDFYAGKEKGVSGFAVTLERSADNVTAADVVRDMMDKAGSGLGITEEKLAELEKYPAANLAWVVHRRKDALPFGKPIKIFYPADSEVITGPNPGYVILNRRGHPLRPEKPPKGWTAPKNDLAERLRKAEEEAAGTGTTPTPTGEPTPPTFQALLGGRADVKHFQGADPARFALVEVDALNASHRPEAGFGKNPSYPEGVQERAYHTDRAEQEKVIANAVRYDPAYTVNTNPDAINGPPIVTPDGLVLGGNSRAMTLKVVYGNYPQSAAKYREALKANAAALGIDPAAVDQMQRPALVRVLDNAPADLARAAHAYNRPPTQAVEGKAEGVSKGHLISEGTLADLAAGMDDFDSLREYLASGTSKSLVRSLMQDGVIEATQYNRLVSGATGLLTEDGKRLVENSLRGAVVDDIDLLNSLPPAALQKLDKAIPDLARLKARGEAWDISQDLKKALADYAQLKAGPYTSVPEYLAQATIFEKPNAAAGGRVRDLLEALNTLTPNKFRGAVKELADLAGQDVAGQGTLGFVEKVGPEQAFRDIFGAQAGPAMKAASPQAEFGRKVQGTEYPGKEPGVMRIRYVDEGGRPVGIARMAGETIGDITVNRRQRRKGYGSAILADLKTRGGRSAFAGSDAGARLLERGGFKNMDAGRYVASDQQMAFPGMDESDKAGGRKLARILKAELIARAKEAIKARREVRTLARAISTDLVQTGKIDFSKLRVTGPETLAMAAQVLRDPRYETFRVFYLRGENIVHHEAVTCGVPSMVVFDDQLIPRLAQAIKNNKADGIYVMHNHPSGLSDPSPQDEAMTRTFAQFIPQFKGHIIIDSGEFSTIDNLGASQKHTFEMPDGDKFLTPSVPSPMNFFDLRGGESNLARFFLQYVKPVERRAIIVYSSARLQVFGVQEVPLDYFRDYDKALAFLKDQAVYFGADRLFIAAGRDAPAGGAQPWRVMEKLTIDRRVQASVVLDENGGIVGGQEAAGNSVLFTEAEATASANRVYDAQSLFRSAPEDLVNRAKEISQQATEKYQPQMDDLARRIGKDSGMVDYVGSAKGVQSIVNKVMRKMAKGQEYAPEKMKDHARGAILVQSWEDAAGIIEALKRNGFDVEGHIERPLNVFGYRGINSSRALAAGINGELQVHTPESWQLKLISDEIYLRWRDYEDHEINSVPELRDAYARDVERSVKMWEDYFSRVPAEVRAAVSSAVSGMAANVSPNLTPAASTQAPASNTLAGEPTSSFRTRPSSSFSSMGEPPSEKNISIREGNVKENRPSYYKNKRGEIIRVDRAPDGKTWTLYKSKDLNKKGSRVRRWSDDVGAITGVWYKTREDALAGLEEIARAEKWEPYRPEPFGRTTPAIETDAHNVQEIKNSIAEGEMILKSGRKSNGAKMSPEELAVVRRSVNNSRAKIGLPALPEEGADQDRKPIWQLTRKEYIRQVAHDEEEARRIEGDKIIGSTSIKARHEVATRDALEAGENVPPEVLVDYADRGWMKKKADNWWEDFPRKGKSQGELDFRKVVIVKNHWGEAYHLTYDDDYSLNMGEPTFFDTVEQARAWALDHGLPSPEYVGRNDREGGRGRALAELPPQSEKPQAATRAEAPEQRSLFPEMEKEGKKKKVRAKQLTLFETLSNEAGFIDLGALVPKPVEKSLKAAMEYLRSLRVAHQVNWLLGKTPENTTVKVKSKYSPQFVQWFRNMGEILSQTTQGRDVYEAGRTYRQEIVQKMAGWRARYEAAAAGLGLQEKAALVKILDTVEDLGSLPAGKVTEAAKEIRALLDDIHAELTKQIPEMGYIKGYFPHVFQGKFWVKVHNDPDQKYLHKMETIRGALQLAKDLAEKTGEKVDIVQDTFIPGDDATMMSRRSFWKLVAAMKKRLGETVPIFENLSGQQIADILAGEKIAKPLPRKRFFGHAVAREIDSPNYSRAIDDVMDVYFYGASRKIAQDKFTKLVQDRVERMKDADRLRKFVQDVYLPTILAHPTNFEEGLANAWIVQKMSPGATGQDVRRWMHKVNLPQYVFDMGLSASSVVANATQFWINAYPVVGELAAVKGYGKGFRTLWDKGLLAEVEAEGITAGVSAITGESIIGKGWLKDLGEKLAGRQGLHGLGEATLEPFQVAEMINRFSAYWAGKDWALKELARGRDPRKVAATVAPKTSSLYRQAEKLAKAKRTGPVEREAFARKVGFELNEKTNFRISRDNLPQILQEAPLRLLSPYKAFLLNQLKYSWETLGPKGAFHNPKAALRFAGMTFALAGAAGNPVLWGIFEGINFLMKLLFGVDLEKELKRRGWWRGASGRAGLDISGSVALNMPRRAEDLLGRYGKVGLELGRLAYGKARDAGTLKEEKTLGRLAMPALVQRTVDALTIIEEGQYRTPIKGTPITLKEAPWAAAVKRVAGMMPGGVAEQFDREEMAQKTEARFKSLSHDYTERWAEAYRQGDERGQDRIIRKVVNRVNEALDNLQGARTQDEATQALVELAFWATWARGQEKFKAALERRTIPRDLYQLKKAPRYMRPAMIEEGEGE